MDNIQSNHQQINNKQDYKVQEKQKPARAMPNSQTVCPNIAWPIIIFTATLSLCSSPNTAEDFRSAFCKVPHSRRDNSPVPKGKRENTNYAYHRNFAHYKNDYMSCCDSKFHATQRSSDNWFFSILSMYYPFCLYRCVYINSKNTIFFRYIFDIISDTVLFGCVFYQQN